MKMDGGFFAIGFKKMFLARPEGEICIINTAPTDNAAQKHFLEVYKLTILSAGFANVFFFEFFPLIINEFG